MSKKRIMVVDDEVYMLVAIEIVLQRNGFAPRCESNPAEALRILREEGPFDLLITDVNMPEMSGVELVRELRAAGIAIPVIASSSMMEEAVVQKFKKEGCDDFLEKPYLESALIAKIVGVFARRGETIVLPDENDLN